MSDHRKFHSLCTELCMEESVDKWKITSFQRLAHQVLLLIKSTCYLVNTQPVALHNPSWACTNTSVILESYVFQGWLLQRKTWLQWKCNVHRFTGSSMVVFWFSFMQELVELPDDTVVYKSLGRAYVPEACLISGLFFYVNFIWSLQILFGWLSSVLFMKTYRSLNHPLYCYPWIKGFERMLRDFGTNNNNQWNSWVLWKEWNHQCCPGRPITWWRWSADVR